MWRTILASSILAVVITPFSAHADTHYVSKTGSSAYPYDSWATAADTVARAVEAASEWDTILVAPGHYVTDTIRMKRGQVLKGAGMDSSILDTLPLNPAWPIIAEDSCTVCDLAIIGISLTNSAGRNRAIGDSSNLVSNSSIRITDDRGMIVRRVRFQDVTSALAASYTNLSGTGRTCRVDSCEFLRFEKALSGLVSRLDVSNSAFKWDQTANIGVIQADFSELVVTGCEFYGYDPTVSLSGAAAISTYRSDPIVVRNCVFHSSLWDPALELDYEDGSSTPVNIGLIENNTFVGFFQHIRVDRQGFLFRNNVSTMDESGSTTPAFYNGFATGEYNITWNNSPWDSGVVRVYDTIPNDVGGNHDNREIYPMFVDTIEFLLQAFSPAIDAGDPSTLDADGSRSDIGYTGGPGGFSYAYPDLPPAAPTGFQGTPSANEITLTWRRNLEADFEAYELFRDTTPILVADSSLMLAVLSSETTYVDSDVTTGRAYFYRVSATDGQGNLGELSDQLQFVASGVTDDSVVLPKAFVLHPNYPNPFNPATSFIVDVPTSGHLRVTVYDLLGRKVAVLHNAPVEPGSHRFTWSTPDSPSGVYFLAAKLNGASHVQKALLLK